MATLLEKSFDYEILERIEYLLKFFRDEQYALNTDAGFDIYLGATLPTLLNLDRPVVNIYQNSLDPEKPTTQTHAQYGAKFYIDCVAPGVENGAAPGYPVGHSDEVAYGKIDYLKYQVWTVLTALINHKFGFKNKIAGKIYPSWEYFQIENKENATVVTAGRWTFDIQYGLDLHDTEHIQELEKIFISTENYSADITY